MLAELRAWLRWALTCIGYVIRPYDVLTDRRRWRWQPRTRCRVIDDPNVAERVRRMFSEGGGGADV